MENSIQDLLSSFGNSETLILLFMFSAVVLLVMGGVGVFAGGDPVKQRLRTRVLKRPGPGGANSRGRSISKAGKDIAAKIGKRQAENAPEKVPALRRKLMMAGYLGSSAVSIFLACRLVGAAVTPILVLLAMPYVAGSLPPTKLAFIGVFAAAIGYYLPSLWVTHRTDKRQNEARQGFPDALDLLLVCVESGLSLAAALNRVGQEIGHARPLLGDQFRLVALEMQAGKTREQALRNMADRIGIDEVRSLVTLLLQSESLGTSIGQSLRVHAEEMRRKRLVRAEERANKLPAKMTIPLVCFILPSLLSVIITPLIITFVRVVAPALMGNA